MVKDKEKPVVKEVHRIVHRDAESRHENIAGHEGFYHLIQYPSVNCHNLQLDASLPPPLS